MKKSGLLMRQGWIWLVVLGLLTAPGFAGQQAVPEEVKDLVGSYTGSWTMYGIDSNGDVVAKMKWTDIMEAKNPAVKNGRAYVETLGKMKFKGGIPEQEIKGTEGYFLKEDGSLGDYYFESFGQVTKMFRIGERTWVYSIPANPGRLGFLGFANVVSGRHVVVKEIYEEAGVEIHRISRVTTVNWKDKEEKSRWKQFVSLRGHHRRQKTIN